MKNPKFFTVKEADQTIGLLETTLERIKRSKQEFLWLQGELAILELIVECGADGNNPNAIELAQKTKRFKRIAENIEKDVAALEATGFVAEHFEDVSEAHLNRPAEAAADGQLTLAVFVDDLGRKAGNARRSLEEGRIRLVRGVFRAT